MFSLNIDGIQTFEESKDDCVEGKAETFVVQPLWAEMALTDDNVVVILLIQVSQW